jgi:hypothetical protein
VFPVADNPIKKKERYALLSPSSEKLIFMKKGALSQKIAERELI